MPSQGRVAEPIGAVVTRSQLILQVAEFSMPQIDLKKKREAMAHLPLLPFQENSGKKNDFFTDSYSKRALSRPQVSVSTAVKRPDSSGASKKSEAFTPSQQGPPVIQ